MRKLFLVAICAGLVAGSLSAPAQSAGRKKKPKKTERVVELTYQCPCVGRFQTGGLTGGNPNVGGGVVPTGPRELWLSGEVVDNSGQPIGVAISQDTDGDGDIDDVGLFCGETDAPMPIVEHLEIYVFVGDISPSCPGLGLGGTVNLTLSNLR